MRSIKFRVSLVVFAPWLLFSAASSAVATTAVIPLLANNIMRLFVWREDFQRCISQRFSLLSLISLLGCSGVTGLFEHGHDWCEDFVKVFQSALEFGSFRFISTPRLKRDIVLMFFHERHQVIKPLRIALLLIPNFPIRGIHPGLLLGSTTEHKLSMPHHFFPISRFFRNGCVVTSSIQRRCRLKLW